MSRNMCDYDQYYKHCGTYELPNELFILLIDELNNLEDEILTLYAIINDLNDMKKNAIDYNNHLIEHAKYHLNLGHLKKMKKILEK